MNDVAEVKRQEVDEARGGDLLSIIERVVSNPDVDIEKVERLLTMQTQMVERQAEIAFNEAFNEMQPNLPAIERKGKSNNGAFAKWEDIQDKINPVLHASGFGLMFKTDTSSDVKVTAILRHNAGHKESTDFTLKPDKSGNKQDVHAVASSVSYAKRYAASALLNIRTVGEDDDGGKAAGAINDSQVKVIRGLIENLKADEERVCKRVKAASVEQMTQKQFDDAMAALERWKKQQAEPA